MTTLPAEVHLDVPFYPNDGDGNQCVLVCGRTMIKRHTGKDVSLAELDVLVGRGPEQWVSTQQLVDILAAEGCAVTYYSKTPLEPFLQGEPFMVERYGKDWDVISSKVSVPLIVQATKSLLKRDCFINKVLTENELCEFLAHGSTVMMCFDNNMIYGKLGEFAGHAVVLVGYTPTEFIYHENGPTNPRPNVHVAKELFMQAWNHPATYNDVVVVTGGKI